MAVNIRNAVAAGLPTYFVGLTLPVVAGLVFMWFNNAPLSYLGLNAGALAAGLMLASLPPSRLPDFAWPMLGAILVATLALPLLLGPELDGISRWIAIGPLRLHAAMLLVPALLVIAARLPEPRSSTLVGAAAIVIALQPDRASAFALLTAAIALFLLTKSRAMLIASAVALAALIATFQSPDELEGVRFVEHVFSFAWIVQPWSAITLGLALIGAIVAMPMANHDGRIETLSGTVGVATFFFWSRHRIGAGELSNTADRFRCIVHSRLWICRVSAQTIYGELLMAKQQWMRRFARWHIWLGWLVGVPIVMWMVTGLVMVARPIDAVRGNHLRVDQAEQALPLGNPAPVLTEIDVPRTVREIRTFMQRGKPVTLVTRLDGSTARFDATDGVIIAPLDEQEAREIVAETIKRGDSVAAMRLFPAAKVPFDFRRPVDVWQAKLTDGTIIYVGQYTGEIEAVRTRWWRLFDFMWGLHIMDLESREDTSHPILILFAALGLTGSLLGTILMFRRRKAKLRT